MFAIIALMLSLINPMQCLGDVDNAVFIDQDLRGHVIEDWQAVAELTGRNIHLGDSFDMLSGAHRVGTILAYTPDGERRTVWIWGSDEIDELYLFVLDNNGIHRDGDNPYLSWHCCAAGAVDKQEFLQVIEGG